MVSSNNAINNTVGASISGVTNTLTVTNPSNTASSAARATLVVGGGTASDPTVNWNVSGVTNWEMGIDNSDSDKWKLSQGTALGTNDTITAFTTGEVLKPRQPGFLAYLNANVANVTGDGTIYTVIFNTSYFDTSSDFNTGTGTFTAPVTGIYHFSTCINLGTVGAAHTGLIFSFGINGATNVARFAELNPANVRFSVANTLSVTGSIIVSLTAGDTVIVSGVVSGGAKTVTVTGQVATPPSLTWFSGYLLG